MKCRMTMRIVRNGGGEEVLQFCLMSVTKKETKPETK